ncbi:ATP-binding cassette domain-containing protein [Myroides sp. M-43]|uniref:ATP-binding cassette domain-containing protein n=1 Tax=Myroides oncorhynchi TaxID=2893756 RepID=UPI001E600032|nr:ATP-binding cassette domain-containing protein [Myroides oncorhynchi]MCC9041533.1 ATP-binding cassette domain-containing protein [Myroides oncorhynchi]
MLKIHIKEKRYGNQVVLENVKFHIATPGIYGVMGKNGQGKTTMFKCMIGLEKYTGSSTLNDNVISTQGVGWCGAEPAVYNELTAEEFYKFYQHLIQQKMEGQQLLFDLPSDKLIKEFSTGMKKKVYLNAIFQKEYPMYILDEPFNGLDIESNYYLMKYLLHLSERSIIFISSHIVDVLYKHCKSIYVIKEKGITLYPQEEFDKIEGTFFN